MKSEEKSIKAISAQAHGEAADNRLLRKKLREKDELISDLRAQIENLNKNLSEKVSQMADMMDKLVAFMMGRGDVTLSDSLRDAVVSGVRAEYEMRERKLKEEFSRQLGNLTSEFEARLAAKDNEINSLRGDKGGEGGNTPSTSLPEGSMPVTPEKMAARNKQLEQQKANLQVTSYGQHTESAKYHHGEQQVENADDLDLDGENVPDERVVEIAREVKARKDMKGVEKARRNQPLVGAAKGGKYDIVLLPDNLPDDAVEIGEDITVRYSYVKGYIRTHIIRRKKFKDSFGKYYHVNLPDKYKNCMGRTQEAVQKYFEDVIEKLYLHSDGAPIYKCYDTGELIVRIACLVHMRRPFYKLKDVSIDAMKMLKIFEDIFKEDRNIKDSFTNPDEITRERVLRIAPLLNDMKSYLDKLKASLSAEEEPELLKAVNYALTEYPCMLRCLEDGSLDLSNNICERQIRRIAKYRNNSFFVGSPEAGVRFARLMSVFANIRNYKLDPVKYLCDVFRRIKNTADDKLVELIAHKWQPATASQWV